MAGDLLLDRYDGAGLAVEVRWTTWELSVFEVEVPRREPIFVAVRRSHLDGFLTDLWAGTLDADLIAQAASPAVQRRRLADGDRVRGVEVVGSVTDPATLPPAERDRRTGRIGSDPPRGRRRKREEQQDGQPPRQVKAISRGVLIGAGAAVVVLVAAVAALAGRGDDEEPVTVGAPVVPPLVSDDTTSSTFQEIFNGTYQMTAVVTEYEETGGGADTPATPFAVGQTITFLLHCGSTLVETGEVQCSPDPRPETVRIDGVAPPELDSYAPMRFFNIDGLDDGSGRSVTEGKPCGDFVEPTKEVQMDGYGEDEISGTYRHTYDSLDCSTGPGEYYLLHNIALSFTGELIDDQSYTTSTTAGGGVELGS